MSETQLQQTC